MQALVDRAHRLEIVGKRRLPEFDEQMRSQADQSGQNPVAAERELRRNQL